MTRAGRERTLFDRVVDLVVRFRLYVAIALAYVTGVLGLAVTLSTPLEPDSVVTVAGILLMFVSFLVFLYLGVSAPTEG